MSHQRNPRALLTPAMRGVLDRIVRAGRLPLHALTPDQARAAYEAGAGVLELAPHKLARVEDLHFSARDGHGWRPGSTRRKSISQCTPAGAAVLPWRRLHRRQRGDARRAVPPPEPPGALRRGLGRLPAGAAAQVPDRRQRRLGQLDAWLRAQADTLGLDASRLAVGGDSAGGTLAAVCAVMARDAGLPLALQLLFYPGCAGHQDTPSHHTFAHGFMLEEAHISYFFGHALRAADDRNDWRFAPLDGRDETGQVRELEGVAPAWIGLAECDPLVDEGVLYADRLRSGRRAGGSGDLPRRGARLHQDGPRDSRGAGGAQRRRSRVETRLSARLTSLFTKHTP